MSALLQEVSFFALRDHNPLKQWQIACEVQDRYTQLIIDDTKFCTNHNLCKSLFHYLLCVNNVEEIGEGIKGKCSTTENIHCQLRRLSGQSQCLDVHFFVCAAHAMLFSSMRENECPPSLDAVYRAYEDEAHNQQTSCLYFQDLLYWNSSKTFELEHREHCFEIACSQAKLSCTTDRSGAYKAVFQAAEMPSSASLYKKRRPSRPHHHKQAKQ